MTDISDTDALYRRQHRHVPLEGDILVPRREFAHDLSVSERTTARWRLPTTYLGNTAYIARNAGMKIVTETLRRRWSKDGA